MTADLKHARREGTQFIKEKKTGFVQVLKTRWKWKREVSDKLQRKSSSATSSDCTYLPSHVESSLCEVSSSSHRNSILKTKCNS